MPVLPATFRVRVVAGPKARSHLPLRQKSPLHEKIASARRMILAASPVALCRASQDFRNSHACHRLPLKDFFARIWFLFLRWKPACPSPALPLSRRFPHTRRCMSMLRKFLCSASLAGLLLSGIAAYARPAQEKPQPKQRSEQTKSASGKVTDIASDKKSFVLQVIHRTPKHTIQFTLAPTP